jgi:hypothetical protein
MLWYCFGVGFANFGSPPAPSVSALRLADHDPRIDFLASYRATGNYVVRAPNDVAGLLRRELNRLTDAEDRWAVVPDDAFEKALTAFEAWQPPDPERLVRWTPGLAFALHSGNEAPSASRTDRAELRPLDAHVVAVYKRDPEIRPGVLNRDRRLGGWGAISHDIERQAGGKWTARSLSVVTGLRSVTRQAPAGGPADP